DGGQPVGKSAGETARGVLRQRQRVHVTRQWDGGTWSSTLQDGDRARTGCRFPPLQRQVGKFGADFAERKRRIEAEFGLGMDGAAQANDARGDLLRPIEELLGRDRKSTRLNSSHVK